MKTIIYFLFAGTILFLCTNSSVKGQQYNEITIYTPNNTAVTAHYLTSGDMSYVEKMYYKNFWEYYYDYRITYISEATHSYNCHGYAWYVSEGRSPNVRIFDDEEVKFMIDHSFFEVPSQSEATKAFFDNQECWVYDTIWWDLEDSVWVDACDHSAITTSNEDYYISKWGPGPVFLHHINDCPYNSQYMDFYVRPYITGLNSVCTTGTQYTLNKVPSGGNITWYPSSYITGCSPPTSNPCVFYGSINGGEGWIDATVTYNGYVNSVTQKDVFIGAPGAPTITDTNGDPPDYLQIYDYKPYMIWTYPGADPSTGDWFASGPIDIDPYGQYCWVQAYETGYAMLYVTTYNDCDMSPEGSAEIQIVSGKRSGEEDITWTISPNPARSYIDLTIKAKESNDKLFDEYTIEFIDAYSRIVKVLKLSGPENRINISELSAGHYFVRLTYSDNTYGKTFIVQ